MEIIHIGFISETDLMFNSEYKISREKADPTLIFLDEKYIKVNNNLNCYIPENQFKSLFEI